MKREKTYNYFYIVNNLLNEHFYLGVHSTDTLADGYFGSGKILKKAIKFYGKENFELTPLKFFKTRKELMDFEREIVNERFLTYYKGICYNLKRGGEGGSDKIFADEELKQHKSEYMQGYYQDNKNAVSKQSKGWKDDNPERYQELQHEWYENNKDAVSKQSSNWRKNNLERSREIHRNACRKHRAKKKAEQLGISTATISNWKAWGWVCNN